MSAPINNSFWQLRSKHGRNKLYETPEALWEDACEYFQWCDDNPWMKNEAVKAGDHFGELVHIPTARPYTEKGMFIFLNIGRRTWDLYKGREDFVPITTRIEDIIYNQKFEGAAVGAFNANIIARDLGLVEKKEVFADVKQNLSEEQLKEIAERLR